MISSPSAFFDKCLAAFGIGHFLLIGKAVSNYAAFLRHSNIPARYLEKESVDAAQLKAFLTQEQSTTATLILLSSLNKISSTEIEQIIHILDQIALRSVCLVANTTQTVDGTLRNTEWWQRRFFSAGFRQHPRAFLMQDYTSREHPSAASILCFEKIPEQARIRYPMEYLDKERMLHMDMLRDPGRRSDAHLVRYVKAAPYIRPGDTVLDCACGLGYGAHILYQNSRAKQIIGMDFSESAVAYATHNYGIPGILDFYQGDAQNLSQLEDNSIDFITSFETIEHLPEPARYLKELARVLRPSGRVMFSAPDKWVDETGKDPNPYHFHVYTWEKLYAEVTEHFIPDKGFIQIAGGALRLPNGKRHWEEVPCDPIMDKEAEWILLLAMKNPLAGRTIPYTETTFPESDNPSYHVGAFKKDYLNPWLVKGIVSTGYRIQNTVALRKLQEAVLISYPEDSVDYGAALCGIGYQLLEKDSSHKEIHSFMKRMEYYVALEKQHPHIIRWKVSLLFVSALLERSLGNFSSAETLFFRCSNYDVTSYSAILGNKILDALYNAAILALGREDIDTAKKYLHHALIEIQHLVNQDSWLNIIHNASYPFEPGLAECAQLMNHASRCCSLLAELKTASIRPGLALETGYWHFRSENQYIQQILNQYKKSVKKEDPVRTSPSVLSRIFSLFRKAKIN